MLTVPHKGIREPPYRTPFSVLDMKPEMWKDKPVESWARVLKSIPDGHQTQACDRDILDCIRLPQRDNNAKYSYNELCKWKKKLRGTVMCPADKDENKMVFMCPVIWLHGIQEAFVNEKVMRLHAIHKEKACMKFEMLSMNAAGKQPSASFLKHYRVIGFKIAAMTKTLQYVPGTTTPKEYYDELRSSIPPEIGGVSLWPVGTRLKSFPKARIQPKKKDIKPWFTDENIGLDIHWKDCF
jgi:hypothetical protein